MLPRAWTQATKNRPSVSTSSPGRARRIRGRAAEWEGTATIAEEAAATSDGVGPRVGDATGHRTLAVAAMPAVLVAGLLGTGGAAKAASTPQIGRDLHPRHHSACRRRRRPRPPTPRASSPSPTPSASSSSAPSASASPSPTPSAGQSGSAPSATPIAVDIGQRLAVPERHVDRRRQVRRQGQEGRQEGRRGAIGHHRLRRRLGAHGRVGHLDRFPVPGQRDHARFRRRDRSR